MPTWGQILNELQTTKAPQGSGWDFDGASQNDYNPFKDEKAIGNNVFYDTDFSLALRMQSHTKTI